MKYFLGTFIIITLFIFLTSQTGAQIPKAQFINIVNPVRVSYYTKDITKNLTTQYSVISNRNLPATWLITYDVLGKKDAVNVLKNMNKDQELGLFLEVTPNFAYASGVAYHQTGSWHFANAVFFSGYTTSERKKLADTLFEKFKNEFGYYPKSVGSWWTDSFTLGYIKDRYGVGANLTVSDQYSTDNYQVWGQYWSVPFYPSKFHSGAPASDLSNKQDVVVSQWAPRDPVRGYESSLYSTQDYKVLKKPLDTGYFEKLVRLYSTQGENKFGQVVVGLESDLAPESYLGEFRNQMDKVLELKLSKEYTVNTMSQFAKWYRENFPGVSPAHKIQSKDLLGENREIIWYQSPVYRLGVLIDNELKTKTVLDLRFYRKNYMEPYINSPNGEINLHINVLSLIDSFQNKDEALLIPFDSEIEFFDNGFLIKSQEVKLPDSLWNHPYLKFQHVSSGIKFAFDENRFGIKDGLVQDYSLESKYFFKSSKNWLKLLLGLGWKNFEYSDYFVSDGEIDALSKLSSLPGKRVMVFDNDCLQCSWHTKARPAPFANVRKYISKIARKKLIYNSSIFKATERVNAREELKKLDIDYIYIAKYENYIEKLPFSPGDLEVERIYLNANAEIWKVNNTKL